MEKKMDMVYIIIVMEKYLEVITKMEKKMGKEK